MAKLKARAEQLLKRALMRAGVVDRPLGSLEGFAMADGEKGAYFPAPSPLEALFLAHQGRTIHKWAHYLPIYERLFGPWRERRPTMLEIGVSLGGSLELWRKYFGPEAVIAGIDVNPDCAGRFDPPNQVFIGSQADPDFLADVIGRIGRPDIVLDDGSHVAEHQHVSFETLFPLLKDGGLYVIEDTHSAYWPETYDGGYRRPGTAIELAKGWVDDMHAWYHREPFDPKIRDQVQSICFYDSIIVLEKKKRLPPRHLFSPPPR